MPCSADTGRDMHRMEGAGKSGRTEQAQSGAGSGVCGSEVLPRPENEITNEFSEGSLEGFSLGSFC